MTERHEHVNYLNAQYGIRSWLLTTDHKRISLLYLISITFFFFIGGAMAVVFRLELLTPPSDLVTIHRMRAPGMTWFRLPLFIWSNYAASIIMVLGTPVIAVTILLVGAERLFHIGVFDPNLGGDPVLFQHMFWFYSHPAVYIMI